MNEFVEKYLTPIKEFWLKLSKKLKIIILSTLGGIIIVAIVIALILGKKEYAVLFSNITPEQAVQVTAALTAAQTEFKSENGGTTILVDKKKEPLIRMQLATEGNPTVTPNFDFYLTNVDFMTTESEKRSVKLYQATIGIQDSVKTIDGVSNAIVNFTVSEESQYAWETEKPAATAAIQVELEPGVRLAPTQVAGIQKIVASAVLGMKPESVAVIDNATGSELKSSDEMGFVDINNFKLSLEREIEQSVENKVSKSLWPVFGKENMTLAVKANMNMDKKVKEIISHTPSTEDDKGIISNSEINKEQVKPDGTTGGVPGAEDNADLPTYEGVTQDGTNIYYKDYEKFEYEVNKTVEQITSDAAALENMTVSISINQDVRSLTEEEIQNIVANVANIAAVSPAKVSILNIPFQKDIPLADTGLDFLQNPVFIISASGGLLLLILVIVFIILMSRRKKKRLEAALAADAALTVPVVIPIGDSPNIEEDIKNTPESREHALRKEIQEFSGKNPQIVAQLIKTWLRGDSDDE